MAAKWGYKHPPRGSCPPGCPRRGRCHHRACKTRPKVSTQSTTRYGYKKGQPRVFCRRHAPLSPSVTSTKRGAWVARGVPVKRVRPLALWLIRRYTTRQAAELVGMSFSGFSQVAYAKDRKRVTPGTAQRIATVVLEHKKKQDPMATFDTDPIRVVTTEERDHMLERVRVENFRWANPGGYYDESVQEEWLRLHDQGWSYSAIARKYHRYHSTVRTAVLNQRAKAA